MSQAVPQPTVVPAWEAATEVLLIRHGRSADVVPGSPASEDPGLHELGAGQAVALAARLGRKKIDAVYSSDLRRAVETATPLAEPRGLVVEQRADLREVFLGDWERGEFRRRAAARDPEWLKFAASGRWDSVPGSEGDDAFRTRVTAAIREIAGKHEGASVAVVCHGGVVNAYLADLYGLSKSFFCTIENTSVTVVRCNEADSVVVAVNDCHHLYDPVVEGPPVS
jgi:2,3-bisphosphoglycerate-dependent phosphoglycerate mutase